MSSFSHQMTQQDISLTEPARAKMAELLADADDDVTAIRVFVAGGGCGGMQYGMTFIDEHLGHDALLELEGVRIVADPVALQFLRGCEIDFKERPTGASFVFNNVFKAIGGSGGCSACGSSTAGSGGGGGGCGSGGCG